MPYTTFTAGAVLTASQLNTNLRDQAVTPFASTSARDSAITSPVEGMVCVVTGEDRLYIYDGAAWQRGPWYSATGRTECRVTRAATQSITVNTPTLITFDTETSDPDGFIGVPSTTLTVPTGLGGIYAVTAAVNWASNPGAQGFVAIVGPGQSYIFTAGSSASNTFAATVTIPLAATNTIQLQVNNSAGTINVTAALYLFRLGL